MENRSGTDTSEAVALQPEKIKLLYARLGKREAEELICRATEKIAQHIQLVGRVIQTDAYIAVRPDIVTNIGRGCRAQAYMPVIIAG